MDRFLGHSRYLIPAPVQRKFFGTIRVQTGVQILTLSYLLSTYCVPSTGPEARNTGFLCPLTLDNSESWFPHL